MCFAPTIAGVAAAACLAAGPALANSQHGHSAAPQTHTTGSKSTAPAPPPRTTTRVAGATTATMPTLNPIAAKIAAKPQLNGRITALLPKNTTLDRASSGFKNQGQFIAALHVSKNVGIPFKDLKNDMTRKNMSLGQSIQDLKKSAASKAEATKGETEAHEDLKGDLKGPASRPTVARTIASNTQLNAKVQALLPSGMTLRQAAKGFTSERQFLAALHAAKDLAIPFADIKAEMTGHDHDTLTRAIQELKPTASATTAARTAQSEAAADITSTNTSPLTNHDGDR